MNATRWVCAAAISILAGATSGMGPWEEAAAFFQKHSMSKEPKSRADAAEKLAAGMDGKHDKQAVQWLINLLGLECQRDTTGRNEESISGHVLLTCEASLKKTSMTEAIDIVVDQAKRHALPRTRFHLARVLGGFAKSDAAAKALIDLSADKFHLVVIGACDGLKEKADPSTLDTLLKLVRKADLSWEARLSVIGAIGAVNLPEKSIEVLFEVLPTLAGDEGRLKVEIIEVLGKFCGIEHPKSDDANWWKTAWADKKSGRNPALTGGTTTEPTAFFGLKSRSTRIVFALDRTGSMEQAFTAPDDMATPARSPAPSPEPRKKLSPAEDGARLKAAEIRKKWESNKPKKKIEGLKKEFISTVYALDPQVWFTVIWYEGNATPWRTELVPATWVNKLDCIQDVDKLQPSGPTNIWDGLEFAFKFISGLGKKGSVVLDKKTNYATSIGGADTLFLMTDGVHNIGKFVTSDMPPKPDAYDFLGEVKKVCALRKITIHTVGLGDVKVDEPGVPADFNEDALKFLQDISESSGGTFRHIGAKK